MRGWASRPLSLIVIGVLSLLLLMRLVWLQNRLYALNISPRTVVSIETFAPRAVSLLPLRKYHQMPLVARNAPISALESLGMRELLTHYFTRDGQVNWLGLIRLSQWQLVSVVLATSLLVRLLTGSWMPALIFSVALLSRGRLYRTIEEIGDTLWVTAAAGWFTLWGCLYARSGSLLCLLLATAALAVGSFFEPAFLCLAIVAAGGLAVAYVWKREQVDSELESRRQTVISTLPESYWRWWRGFRWWWIDCVILMIPVVCLGSLWWLWQGQVLVEQIRWMEWAALLTNRQWQELVWTNWRMHVDLLMTGSLITMLLGLTVARRIVGPSLIGAMWMTLGAILILSGACLAMDALDWAFLGVHWAFNKNEYIWQLSRLAQIWRWFEPIIFAMGFAVLAKLFLTWQPGDERAD